MRTPPSPAPAVPQAPLTLQELTDLALAREAMPPRTLYLSLRGRIPRRIFWLHGVLTLLLVAMMANALLDIAGVHAELSAKLINLALAWPFIAVSVKRQHDYNFSGWWVLVNLVPGIGSLITLVANGFVSGTRGTNRFGPDPLESSRTGIVSTGH